MIDADPITEQVRDRYASAARQLLAPADGACCSTACCSPTGGTGCGCAATPLETSQVFGSALYSVADTDGLPADALLASLGCGNPTAVADLRPGEVVLDLGSGGGIDVLLSARRVGPSGHVYGLDMTDEMLELAEANKAESGLTNVEFLKGRIENIPLPGDAVDVIISNCVINLSADKNAVVREMFRVLRSGGHLGLSDVVAENHLTAAQRAERGSLVGCIAGAYSRAEYAAALVGAGFVDVSIEYTHEVAPEMHGAIVKATKPH